VLQNSSRIIKVKNDVSYEASGKKEPKKIELKEAKKNSKEIPKKGKK